MKNKKMQLVTVCLFCGFLGIMGILYGVLPKQEFSDLEKRYLKEPPELTARTLSTGDWGAGVEEYLADHMPGRDFFVGLNAYWEKLTGRQMTKDIRVSGDALREAPQKADPEAVEKNLRSIGVFLEKAGKPADLMIIPSAGFAEGLAGYHDGEIIEDIYRQAGEDLNCIDLTGVLTGGDFYRTDHHWTSEGAWKAYRLYGEACGKPVRTEFQKEAFGPFRGSTYSRSGLWLTPGENVELWTGSENLQVTVGEDTRQGIFWRENLEKPDMYTVFLGGNHPLVRIRNPEKTGKLLVIRDSYSNCLGGFLAESFGEVVLLDLRYYKQPAAALAQQEDFDRILICYGLGNFLNDRNLVFLQR